MRRFTSVTAAEVTITARDPVREAAERVLGRLWIDQVPVRLASEDASLWGPAPAGDAAGRCWPGQPGPVRALLPRIAELTGRARELGLTEVVLLGSAVPALAADVIARSEGAPLTVLDTPDPAALFRVGLDHERLLRTIVVVTADDPGTDALRRVFLRMFQGLDLSPAEIADRFVLVTGPDGPPAGLAEAGHPVVAGPAGLVFGALSPQALVPAALAGVDVAKLLDQATAVLPSLTRPENNPGLVLGALLGGCARAGRDTVIVGAYRSPYELLGDWIGALLSGATGGALLPLVQYGGVPVPPGDDLLLVSLDGRPWQDDATVTGPLGAQLVVWEYAAAVAGYLLGSGPPPEPAEEPATALVAEAETEPEPPDRLLDSVGVHSLDPEFASAEDLTRLFDALEAAVPPDGHLAIRSYLDQDPVAGQGRGVHRLAAGMAARCARPVTVTWRPCHPAFADDRREKGVYLMLTGEVMQDVPVPDRHYRLGRLRLAQATGGPPASGQPLGGTRPATGSRPRRGMSSSAHSARTGAGTIHNPLRDPRDKRLPRVAGPSVLVLFGVTGDLSRKKLLPAIYDLANRGLLPPGFSLVGFARRDWADQDFRQVAYEAVKEYARTPFREDVWTHLSEGMRFVPGEFSDPAAFDTLASAVKELDQTHGTGGNYAFYLSIPPKFFPQVVERLQDSGLADRQDGGWRRVVIEKPFGHDLASAQELNDTVHRVFPEESIFRIDHYLGKETVQNILALRFANTMYEPIWNRSYVDHVQITMAEDIGIGGRAGYYDGIGAARDVIQNHLLQLLALTAMEEPTSFSAEAVRAEKAKILSSVRVPADLSAATARGQYAAGWQGGDEVRGYLEEEGIPADSRTETYAAIKLEIESRRWAGVPFYLRTGKRLSRRATEVALIFQRAPHLPFSHTDTEELGQNSLVVRVQPDEGITVRFGSKVPGTSMEVRDVNMDFAYGESFTESSPEAYERLLLDVLIGDPPLFPRQEEVELSWEILDPIELHWAEHGRPDQYKSGGYGPACADELMARDGRCWRRI